MNRESVKTLKYGENTAGKLLLLAHRICEVESDAGLGVHKLVSWEGNVEIFGGTIGLSPAELKVAPNRRSWLVDSVMVRLDDEGELKVGATREGHTELADDSFLEYYYDMAAELFYGHVHEECVDAFMRSQPTATALATRRNMFTGEVV
jgi:hypothetical protein